MSTILKLREAMIPLALQQTRMQVGARIPPDYLPPPQRAAAPGTPPSQNRKDMLDLVDKWFGTKLSSPRVPAGETKDLLALAGWTKARGEASFKDRQDNQKNGTHIPIVTSCGDVLAAMLRLWKSGYMAAFGIRDVDASGHHPGARERGYYVEANGSNAPVPGDILVLRNGVGPQTVGPVGHVDILVALDEAGTA